MTDMSWRRMTTWAIRLLLVAVLAAVAFAVAVLTVLPHATHGKALAVLTGSMTPDIPVGSVVLVRPVDPGTLRVGDVATYQKAPGKSEYITHRIVGIDTSTTPASFTFKGDANRGADVSPVPATAIRGKVWFHVPYLGGIRDTLHTKSGLAGVVMLLLAGYAFVQLRAGLKDRESGSPSASAAALEAAPAPLIGLLSHACEPAGSRVPIFAVLPVDAFEGLAPRVVTLLLGGVLLDADATTFTLLLTEPAERAADTLLLLKSFGPLSLQTALPSDTATPADGVRLETEALTPEYADLTPELADA